MKNFKSALFRVHSSKNTVPENTVSENTVSENTVPENNVPDSTVPECTVPDSSFAENSISVNVSAKINVKFYEVRDEKSKTCFFI